MTTALQHFGKVINTRQPCVVVFKQLGEDPTNCLVVEYETVPEPLKTMLLEAVKGNKAQQTPDLSIVLSEIIIPDTGGVLLDALHIHRFLKKTPIDNVLLTPTAKETYLLSDILKYIRYSAEGQYFHVKNLFEPDVSNYDPKQALDDFFFPIGSPNTNNKTHVTELAKTNDLKLSSKDAALYLLQESNNLQKAAMDLLQKASAMMSKSQTLRNDALAVDPELKESFLSESVDISETKTNAESIKNVD